MSEWLEHGGQLRRRQGQQAPDRAVQCPGVTAGKVAPRRAVIGHEQGVAHEHRFTKAIGSTGWRVTGHEHHLTRQHAQWDAFSLLEKMVELRAILFETRL